MNYQQTLLRTDSNSDYLLKPLGSGGSWGIPIRKRGKRLISVTIIVIASLVVHIILGIVCCILAVRLRVDSQNHTWLTLCAFGVPLSLYTARYLNFSLDVGARVFSLTLELLLAFVGLRTATTLWTAPSGIRVSDAITLNSMQLEVASIWATLKSRVGWLTRTIYILSVTCGMIVYYSGSLIFGYENLIIQRAENQDVQVGGNRLFVGSNSSGQHIAPDYSALTSNDQASPFAATVLRTLTGIDLSRPNVSISSFDLSVETPTSLLSRNITSILVRETISTRLVNCQPVPVPTNTSFGFYASGSFVTRVVQNLTAATSGRINRFQEEIYVDEILLAPSKFQTFTFLMTMMEADGPMTDPVDDSQVMIVLAYRGICLPDPTQTAFGPIPHASLRNAFPNTNGSIFPHNHAALVCQNTRILSRTVYAPDGAQLNHTSQTFYARPIISTVNRLYLYTPIEFRYSSVANTIGTSIYGGIGSLLNEDLVDSVAWQIPGCTPYVGAIPVPPTSTEIEAVSTAWSQAVTRVQHYETSVLQAFVKQNYTAISAPVMVTVSMYRLAVIPAALFVYGLAMVITASLLLAALFGGGHKHMNSTEGESLSVWKIASELGAGRGSDSRSELEVHSGRTLRKELGMTRIRRRARL